MKTIRHGVFETNSSSTHSLTIMTKEEYDKWDDTNYLCGDKIYTFEEAKESCINEEYFTKYYLEESKDWTKEDWEEHLSDHEFYTLENFGGDYETFHESFTTPSGDHMVAFGYSGYDG